MSSRVAIVALIGWSLIVVGCSGPAPTSAPPSASTPPSPSAALDRADLLRAHIREATASETELIQSLVGEAADADLEGIRLTISALTDWASTETGWANEQPFDPCTEPVIDAYRDAAQAMTLATIDLSLLIFAPGGDAESVAEEVRQALAAIELSHQDLAAAARLAEVTFCVGPPPSPSAVVSIELTPERYLAMAHEVNAAMAEAIAASDPGDPRIGAEAQLAALERVRDVVDTWTGSPPELERVLDQSRGRAPK